MNKLILHHIILLINTAKCPLHFQARRNNEQAPNTGRMCPRLPARRRHVPRLWQCRSWLVGEPRDHRHQQQRLSA